MLTAPLLRAQRLLPLDLAEDDNGFTIRVDVPGVSRDKLRIDVDERLTIHVENGDRAVSRAVRLPSTADLDTTTADLKDGVLDIRVTKKPRQTVRGKYSVYLFAAALAAVAVMMALPRGTLTQAAATLLSTLDVAAWILVSVFLHVVFLDFVLAMLFFPWWVSFPFLFFPFPCCAAPGPRFVRARPQLIWF
ncbi:hypothetical protein CTAYLR_008222 [Chrysophaeum taylorii]|uniref:SHSP domain-containing protein n=1 Tax=Chrysophaeum taylorii TaxID=2483200 RepID=A0AAD7UKU5_9STRA|nr:hypothetical protein CTAYLR_008222 [Chrysophaeum taylorii]